MDQDERPPRPGNPIARAVSATVAWALRRRAARAALLYLERRGPSLADGITYRALFSVFAAVLLGFSAAGLWLSGNPEAFDALVRTVGTAIPGLVGEGGLVDPARIRVPAELSVTGAVSLIALVGATIGAVGSLRTALRTLAGTLADDVFWLWVILRNLALAAGIGLAFAFTAFATFSGTAGIRAVTGFFGARHGAEEFWAERLLDLVVVFALDTLLVAALFLVLSGVRAPARALWQGALLGGAGLLVLQQLSGLFVGGARANPLLASFAALIALLLWLNLSAQVLLYAGAYVITAAEDEADERSGHPQTFAERRLERAVRVLAAAEAERETAEKAVAAERRPR
ncbi:membrane protein [Microbacterium resistens]|uniref:Membrane protein n=1 Tax=Microbacterium resistens TaxID=156977 RepID=A0ABU1SA03_9MICO|nr:YhjD/YihY/BrkB family envelope integrity protein [Microbacterium resistens]MDR6866440.1 membrane protein [Microbacterium resistens]